MTELRYGILSTSSIAPRFISGVRECGKGRIVALSSRNLEKAAEKVNQRDIANATGMSLGSVSRAMSFLTEAGFVKDNKITRIIVSDLNDFSFDGFTFEASADGTVIKAGVGEQIIADAEGNATIVEIFDTIKVTGTSATVTVGSSAVYTALSGLQKTHEWERITDDGRYEGVFHWRYQDSTYLVVEGDPDQMEDGDTFHAFKLNNNSVENGYIIRKNVKVVIDTGNNGDEGDTGDNGDTGNNGSCEYNVENWFDATSAWSYWVVSVFF